MKLKCIHHDMSTAAENIENNNNDNENNDDIFWHAPIINVSQCGMPYLDDRHFADDIFKFVLVFIPISLKCVLRL